MVIKLVLSAGLILSLLYAQGRSSTRLLKLSMTAVVVAGSYLIWFPEHSTIIAQAVGVGRGADLVAYIWIVISLLLILALHLRTTRLKSDLTELARHIAILEAEDGR